MKSARKLVLRKDRLAELTTADLRAVAAGDDTPTLPVNRCLSIRVCVISEGVRCALSDVNTCQSDIC